MRILIFASSAWLSISAAHAAGNSEWKTEKLADAEFKVRLVSDPAEITGILERLSDTQRLAAAVFVSGDIRSARLLIKEKEIIRDLETQATEAHFARMRSGLTESVETSSLHIDILRDLRRINAHLVAAAYPVLVQSGELLPSRLKEDEAPLR